MASALQWTELPKGLWTDLDVYRAGSAALMRGEPLYEVTVHDLPFTYPPLGAAVLVPLAWFSWGVSGAVLSTLSLACLLIILMLCSRVAKLSTAQGLLCILGGLAIEPFQRNFSLGQINLFLIALVVVDLLWVPRRFRGYATGLAIGIKLTPGVFLIFFALKRDWGSLLRAVGGFVATVVVGVLVAPRDSLWYWSGGFISLGRFGGDSGPRADNQSLLAEVLRLTGQSHASPNLALLVAAFVVAVGAAACWRQLRARDELAALSSLALTGLLASPISWTHHWLWILPALTVLVARRRHITLWAIGAVLWIAPMWWTYAVGSLQEIAYTWPEHVVAGSYVWIGIFLLGYFALRRPETSRGMQEPGPGVTQGAGSGSAPAPVRA